MQNQLNRGTDAASDQQLNVTPEPKREMIGRERTVGIRLEFGQEVDGGKTGEGAIESEVFENCSIPVFELILNIEQRIRLESKRERKWRAWGKRGDKGT